MFSTIIQLFRIISGGFFPKIYIEYKSLMKEENLFFKKLINSAKSIIIGKWPCMFNAITNYQECLVESKDTLRIFAAGLGQ